MPLTHPAKTAENLPASPQAAQLRGELLTAAAWLVRDEVGSDGQGDVGYGRKHADQYTACDQQVEGGCQGHEYKRNGDGGVHLHHQAAAFQHIAERNKGEQPQRVADLGCDCHEAGTAGRGAVGGSHLQQERLVVVHGGYPHGTGQPKEGQGGVRGGFSRSGHTRDCSNLSYQ